MSELILSRRTAIWLVLAAATALSWRVGHGGFSIEARWASAALIVIALVKIRFVILDFMELRHAPLPFRLAGEAWVVAVASTLLGIYLTGAPA